MQAYKNYRITLTGDLASRRTVGLFDHEIRFTTGNATGPRVEIVEVTPRAVDVDGGELDVTLHYGTGEPRFSLSGQEAAVLSQTSVGTDLVRYRIQAPANNPGPATLTVTNGNGSKATQIGAVQYIEPLLLKSLAPQQGSLNGGTRVRITGQGFRFDGQQLTVNFGSIPVDADAIKVIDTETLEVVTPGDQIGTVDVEVILDNGQRGVLKQAFSYLQPVQSNIKNGTDHIYDLALDPSGNYLLAAQGANGVVVYDINASNYTTDVNDPQNLDDLLRTIDRNGDDLDDRVLASIRLPSGYRAVGIDTFFEKGADRVFVTAVRMENGQPVQARLFVAAFDSIDISNSTIIKALDLPSTAARGMEVVNNRALLAMGEAGLGIVDSYLHTKLYLVEQFGMPDNKPLLDVTQMPITAGQASRYIAVGGAFDYVNNRLTETEQVGSGGFYVVEQDNDKGFNILASLDIPASRVKLNGNYAYLAAGDSGMVIVDLRNLLDPQVIARVNNVGFVHDIDVSGNTVYIARGQAGILSVDVTDPYHPLVKEGMDAFEGNYLESVVASNYSAIAAGKGVVQITPDVILKLHTVDPVNRILDLGAEGEVEVQARFNKAIDLYPANNDKFYLLDANGRKLSATVNIVNNDAILTIDPTEVSTLQLGDQLTLVAEAGIAAVKPDNNGVDYLLLYTLLQEQRITFTYRGARNDQISIEAVVPRRVQLNQSALVTVSVHRAPADANRLRLYVGEQLAAIESVSSNDDQEAVAIITASIAAISNAGQYDVTVEVEKDGVWQQATLFGGLVVDAPIRFDALLPLWGPVSGGTVVTISGEGFEPGNTVMEGLKIRVGSIPVSNISVFSTSKIQITTPKGVPGLHNIYGEDRYGNQTSLIDDNGFGYGLKQLAAIHPSLVFPSDIFIDDQTGVAITNAGYMYQGYTEQSIAGTMFPDNYRAASFDIQDPYNPMLVGGESALPSSGDDLLLKATAIAIQEGRGGAFSEEEQQRILEIQQAVDFATSLDSIHISPAQELEEGVLRKRLYVASGNGGVARLNLDEQNGLQMLHEEKIDDHTINVLKQGHSLFAATSVPSGELPQSETCTNKAADNSPNKLLQFNYRIGNDPVAFGSISAAGSMLYLNNGWLYSGGGLTSRAWATLSTNLESLHSRQTKRWND